MKPQRSVVRVSIRTSPRQSKQNSLVQRFDGIGIENGWEFELVDGLHSQYPQIALFIRDLARLEILGFYKRRVPLHVDSVRLRIL